MIVGGSVRERWQVHSPTCATPVDRPEVQILDWMMPGMGGIEGCQKLSESNERPYAYVLLLTGRSRKEDLLAGLESGADDYWTKPFDAQELRARLHVGQRILDLQDKRIAAGEELSVPRHARAPDGRGKSRRDSGYFRAQTLAAGARRWVFRDRPRGSRPLQICERQLRALGGRRCVTRNDPADDAIGASLPYGGPLWRPEIPDRGAILGRPWVLKDCPSEFVGPSQSKPLPRILLPSRSRRALASQPAPRHARSIRKKC